MAFVASAAAVATLGYGVYSGEQGARQQRKSLIEQKKAQGTAEASAMDQQRKAEQELRRANQKQPVDPTAALAALYSRRSKTLLTTPGGIDPNQLSLGKPKLLGQ